MGCFVRTFREEPLARPCVSQVEPSNSRPRPVHEGSREKPLRALLTKRPIFDR